MNDPFGLHRRAAAAAAEGAVVVHAPAGGVTDVVVLDRVDDVAQADTDYCIHGKATCVGCGEWVWLGDRTHDLVSRGVAAPLCRPCAATRIPADARTAGNAADHRRAAGAH